LTLASAAPDEHVNDLRNASEVSLTIERDPERTAC
jgi:hypothetical protein